MFIAITPPSIRGNISVHLYVHRFFEKIEIFYENTYRWFNGRKEGSRRYLAKTKRDADYTDDTALLVNTQAQAKSLMHSTMQATRNIDPYTNANKIEFTSSKQEEAIFNLRDKPLKLIDQFNRNILSTEGNVNIPRVKTWNIICKSALFDKIKRDFFQIMALSILINRCTTLRQTKCIEKNT